MSTLATISSSPSLRGSRRLAAKLLSTWCGSTEAQISGAHRAFRELLRAGDAQALEASVELTDSYHAPRSEPYFLELLQAAAQGKERKRSGMYYTPWPVAEWIVRRIEQLAPAGPLRIVDPACGGGVFLLAAMDLAQRRPGSSLVGYDLSAAAVAVTAELLEGSAVPASIRQANPLSAGDQLQDELLSGGSPPSTLVVLGNPPYANFGRRNRGPWIDRLVADYRRDIDEQKLNLTDDFIKFLRWGQYWIDRAGRGVLAMITSRTYLTGLTHRGMRRSLADSFQHIEIVDLHGDGDAGDANVFPIRRGVAIGVFAKGEQPSELPLQLRYDFLRGSRAKKLLSLRQVARPRRRLIADQPDWLFAPSEQSRAKADSDYFSWPRMDQIFNEFISGVQTKNDALFVDFDRDSLESHMQEYLAARGGAFDPTFVRPYVVGPFDRRWIYYEPRLLGRPRWQVMRHMLQAEPNVALVFMRQSTSSDTYDHALVVDTLASDRVFYSRRGAPFLAPLWLISQTGSPRTSNLNEAWADQIATKLGVMPEPRSLLGYVYAVLHSPGYRQTNLAFLQRDFPRIPWPTSNEAFSKLSELGTKLIACHLSSSSECPPLDWIGNPDRFSVARGFPRAQGNMVQLNRDTGLHLTDPTIWTFHAGGHRVLERWLKVRRGRQLSLADLQQLTRLCDISVTTQQLAREIDAIMGLQ